MPAETRVAQAPRPKDLEPHRRPPDRTLEQGRQIPAHPSPLPLALITAVAVAAAAFGQDVLIDETLALGLDFEHVNGMNGRYLMVENVGPGVALLDLDRDGDLDLYAVQGGDPGRPPGTEAPSDRLWRNDVTDDGRRRFVDVTRDVGLSATGYGMGVVVGDFDADGWDDLFVLNYGANELWLNRGGDTLTLAPLSPALAGTSWSVSGAAADYDGDGDLDLYVANYLEYSVADNRVCRTAGGSRDYCAPDAYRPALDQLLRNRGDGTFENVSARSGIAAIRGPALGVLATDLDADGRIDFYVANDGAANVWWRRSGSDSGGFVDGALGAGLALNASGAPEASMGLLGADLDGDGDEDLVATHLTGETHTVYRQLEPGLFEDATVLAGLAGSSRRATGFGIAALDIDGDRWLDLYVANGAVRALEDLERAGDAYPLHQRNQLFRSSPPQRSGVPARFSDVSGASGAALATSEVSRGVAAGDIDNDGDIDLVVANNNGPLRVLVNQLDPRHWVGFGLQQPGRPGRVESARVVIELGDGHRLTRLARASSGFASAQDRRLAITLPAEVTVDAVEVFWVGSESERFDGPFARNRYVELRAGKGVPIGLSQP